MKKTRIWLVSFLLLVSGAVGCGYGTVSPETVPESPVPTASMSEDVPTSLVIETNLTAIPQIAPSYEEIIRGFDRITKTPEHPNGPDIGDDGFLDSNLAAEIGAYQASLSGKKIDKWQAWYIGYDERAPADRVNNVRFSVSLLMRAPESENDHHADIVLNLIDDSSVTLLQLQSLKFGQPLSFSGTIIQSLWTGRIYVDDGVIETSLE